MKKEKYLLIAKSIITDSIFIILGIVMCVLKHMEILEMTWTLACLPFILLAIFWLLDFLIFGLGYMQYRRTTQDAEKMSFLEFVLYEKGRFI